MNKTLLSILAGLGGMFGWGTSDFLANNSSEKIGHSKTFFWSQVAGFVTIIAVAIFMAPNLHLPGIFFPLAIFCGIAYALGYLFFYKGFEIGNVSVISAVINLQVLFVIIISLFRGQELSLLQVPAIIILLIGVLVVSTNFDDLKKGTVSLLAGVRETFIAAVIFGVFYWPVNEFIVEQVDWLTVGLITKFIALIVVFGLSLFQKQSLEIKNIQPKLILLLASVGILEAIGVLSATFGQSYGDGVIVAPISSALTVVTVALAMIFSKEKITRFQLAGIALVVFGIILTAF
ncbi:MAG: DMT family transporter [Candidatus Dojkabacteria bacterium]|nr:MAG: DMT family transporter [Candidatus Dojkabacteria bacterium]